MGGGEAADPPGGGEQDAAADLARARIAIPVLARLVHDCDMTPPQSTAEILVLLERLIGESVSQFQVLGINSLKSVTPSTKDLEGRVITAVRADHRKLEIELGDVRASVDLQRTGRLAWLETASQAKIGHAHLPTLRLILESGSALDFTEPAKTKRISLSLAAR